MISFDYPYNFDPFIPTEETMFDKLETESKIDDSWELHKLPLAHLINVHGVSFCQSLINNLDKSKKKILVCQHILVDQLQVDDNTVLASPHASFSNDVISIPHYPVNGIEHPVERKELFGFVGSTSTHYTRKGIVKLFPKNCKDSGVHWGLDLNLPKDISASFSHELSKCHFGLCPRGTGISSVRLFEAMSIGTIPVIIADGYRPPLHSIIDWKSISVSIPENKLKYIPSILSEFTSKDIKDMRTRMQKVYMDYLSPNNFHKSIELIIQ